jgi:hypothetical protein
MRGRTASLVASVFAAMSRVRLVASVFAAMSRASLVAIVFAASSRASLAAIVFAASSRASLAAIVFAAASCAKDHAPSASVDPRCEMKGAAVWKVADAEPAARADVAPPETPVGGLCDGTSELRLVISARNTHPVGSYTWAFQLGGAFLIVDGHCHYYAAYDPWQGVAEGHLSAGELAELTQDLALNRLGDLRSTLYACGDHYDELLVATRDQSLRCACNDCVSEPESTAAIQHANEWVERLANEGDPYAGPVRALALQGEPPELMPPFRTQTVLPWPLSRSIDDFPGLAETGPSPRPGGASFSPPQAAELRKLRRATGEMRADDEGSQYGATYVHDCSDTYKLLMHDLLPDETTSQVDAFLPMAWTRPKLASCQYLDDMRPRNACKAD